LILVLLLTLSELWRRCS